MNKYAKYIVSMTLALPITSEAVTLGNLTVKSYLNQPLEAYIRLIDLGGVRLSGIKVRLASPEAFKRAQLPRPYELSKLSFKLTRRYGKPIVKVTSIERIDEPFMTFMLDLTWAKGQYYRTYTVLLDPPGYDLALASHKPPRLRKKEERSDWYTIGTDTKKVTSNYIKTPLPVNAEKLVSGTFGPVKAKDDLWQIAMRYKPANISVYQVMISLLAFNNEAFTSSNINGLKTGIILDIPTYKVMASIPSEKAKLEVEAQTRAWKKNVSPTHVLNPSYLKRSHYETKRNNITPKTSYLPSMTIDAMKPKNKTVFHPPKMEDPLALDAKKSNQNDLKKNVTSTSPAEDSNQQLPTVKLLNKSSQPKEQVFDDFIPIPAVLTKIIKEPNKKGTSNLSLENEKKSQPITDDSIEPSLKKESLAPELAVAASAIATVKESNTLLRDQVKTLLKQNELLQQEAVHERKSVAELKKKIEMFSRMMAKEYVVNEKGEYVKRKSVKSATHVEEETSSIYWILLSVFAVMILSGAGAFGLFYLNQQGLLFNSKEKDDDDEDVDESQRANQENPITPPTPIDSTEESSPSDEASTNRHVSVIKTSQIEGEQNEPEKDESTSLEVEPHQDIDYELSEDTEELSPLDTEGVQVENNDSSTMETPPDLENTQTDIESTAKREGSQAVEAPVSTQISPDTNSAQEDSHPPLELDAHHKEEDSSLETSSPDQEDSMLSDTPEKQNPNSTEDKDPHLLDFEPGLAPDTTPDPEKDKPKEPSKDITQEEGFVYELEPKVVNPHTESSPADKNENPHVIEDNTIQTEDPHVDDPKPPPTEVNDTNRVKASTQLALAETYITMEDFESAKAALEDVLESGNDKQKARAKSLIERIDKD